MFVASAVWHCLDTFPCLKHRQGRPFANHVQSTLDLKFQLAKSQKLYCVSFSNMSSLKYGFCKKLLRCKWTSDQLNHLSSLFFQIWKKGKKLNNFGVMNFLICNFISQKFQVFTILWYQSTHIYARMIFEFTF